MKISILTLYSEHIDNRCTKLSKHNKPFGSMTKKISAKDDNYPPNCLSSRLRSKIRKCICVSVNMSYLSSIPSIVCTTKLLLVQLPFGQLSICHLFGYGVTLSCLLSFQLCTPCIPSVLSRKKSCHVKADKWRLVQ